MRCLFSIPPKKGALIHALPRRIKLGLLEEGFPDGGNSKDVKQTTLFLL